MDQLPPLAPMLRVVQVLPGAKLPSTATTVPVMPVAGWIAELGTVNR